MKAAATTRTCRPRAAAKGIRIGIVSFASNVFERNPKIETSDSYSINFKVEYRRVVGIMWRKKRHENARIVRQPK